jgi:hypothetical protein
MKHLLTGVAMAAALAIAAPVWAQNAPMTPSSPAPAAKAPAAPKAAAATPTAKKPMKRRMASKRMGSGDQMTEQLNQQELQRIMGGGGAPAPAPAPMPGGHNPTSGTAGPFAPSGMSAPPPPR